jgi:hypothetical protein
MAINAGRVVVGGLIAGVVRLIGGAVIRALIIGPLFLEQIKRNQPEMLAALESPAGRAQIVVLNLLMGIALIYMYAAMRPRFASRLATVVSAAIPAWLIASLVWGITAAMGFFSWPNVIVEALASLVMVLVAVYLGSSAYKDAVDARSPSTAAL